LSLRNALRVEGKYVGASDHDLAIYTPKGMPWILEEKKGLEILEGKGHILMKVGQILHLKKVAEITDPAPTVLVVVYSDSMKTRDDYIYVAELNKIVKKVRLRGSITMIRKILFKKMTVEQVIVMLTDKISEPEWWVLK